MVEIITRREARASSLPRYFTGEPCKYGHRSERYTKTKICIECCQSRNRETGNDGLTRAQRHYWNDPLRAKKAAERQRRRPDLAAARTKRWAQRNPAHGKMRNANRRARKINATIPGWGAEIQSIYSQCPKGFEIDHIVPLAHDLVCGLHVPWNLRPLTRFENRSKGNKFDPDDPLQGSLALRQPPACR